VDNFWMTNTMPPNIVAFNDSVVLILGALYERFPRKTTLRLWEMAGMASFQPVRDPDQDSPFDPTDPATRFLVFVATLDYLRDEQLVVYDGPIAMGCARGVRLTAKALTLLGSLPAAIDPKKADSLGVQIVNYSKKATESVVFATAKDLVMMLLKGLA
jgi:hypothetical protein